MHSITYKTLFCEIYYFQTKMKQNTIETNMCWNIWIFAIELGHRQGSQLVDIWSECANAPTKSLQYSKTVYCYSEANKNGLKRWHLVINVWDLFTFRGKKEPKKCRHSTVFINFTVRSQKPKRHILFCMFYSWLNKNIFYFVSIIFHAIIRMTFCMYIYMSVESVHIWCAIESEKIIWLLVSYRLLKRPIKECIFDKSVMRVYLWSRLKSIMIQNDRSFKAFRNSLCGAVWIKMNPNMVNIQSKAVQLIVTHLRVIQFFLHPCCMIRMKWPRGQIVINSLGSNWNNNV